MIVDPVFPPAVIAGLVVVLAGFAAWRLATETRPTLRREWGIRLLMVLLLLVISLRPSIPGSGTGSVASGGLEVYFVVDTTSSIAAEDYAFGSSGAPGTRLDGVKADLGAITAALPGAQFSLTTFDSSAVQRVPLTSDATALVSATEALTPEITFYSKGSSIDAAMPFLTELLSDAQRKHPERQRVLFYLGDGEQTRDQVPASFSPLTPFIGGGSVLGYGTSAGGVMRVFDGFSADDDPANPSYIQDPSTGADAVSVNDPGNLEAIASQLGVPYRQRSAGESIEPAVAGIDVGRVSASSGTVEGPIEFYWIFALPLALLALREVVAAGFSIAGLRAATRRRS